MKTIEPATEQSLKETAVTTASTMQSRTTMNSTGDLPLGRLAIYGGIPAVTKPYREKWRQITHRAMLRLGKRMRDDVNTHDGRGYEVLDFEQQFAKLTESSHALLMNSGTAALHSAYVALGVKPGDEVIVPSYTFFATVAPILQCGATPVFCEIDPRTLTVDPSDVERRITDRTRAISVVHVWGNPADMSPLAEIAKSAGVGLVEDCSHAHGAIYRGRPVGTWGDIGCFSLQGSKAVSGGEAGIAVTNNGKLFDRMLALAHYPRAASDQVSDTVNVGPYSLGLKYRPHLYAVILAQESLRRLPELNRCRTKNLDILCQELAGCSTIEPISCQQESARGGFLSFMFRYHREHCNGWNVGAFCHAVRAEGVPMNVDRYSPLHTKRPFSGGDFSEFGGAIHLLANLEAPKLPTTDTVCAELVSLPAFTAVSEDFVRQCGAAIRKVATGVQHLSNLRSGT